MDYKKTKDSYKEFTPKTDTVHFPQFELKVTHLKSGETKLEYKTKVKRLSSDNYLYLDHTEKVKILTGDTLKKATDKFNHFVQNQRLYAKIG